MNRNVILLSIVSFLNDISSEIILSVLPLFILALGGGGFSIGLVGGFRDAIANLLKILSGYLSDRLKRKKPFVFAGYLISSIFKLFLGFAKTPLEVLLSTSLERVGKGIRTAPRDAIISLSGKRSGRNFGIHRAFDTLGALFGSLLAIHLVKSLNLSYEKVIRIAAILSFLAILPIFLVREPEENGTPSNKEHLKGYHVSGELKEFLIISSLFSLSNLSYMFFIVKAKAVSDSNIIPLVLYAAFNFIYALCSTPAGIASDRFGRGVILSVGYILFGISLFVIRASDSISSMAVSFLIYGLSMAIVDGTQRAVVSDLSGEQCRGSAFGLFHTVTGLALLLGNLLAGILWNVSSDNTLLLYGTISLGSGLLFAFRSSSLSKFSKRT